METIKIGALEWTTKNLDLLEMQDGSTLTVAKSFKEWIDLCNSEKPCAAAYDFNEKNKGKYGFLYNSFAIKQASKWIPDGWRISTRNDWEDLFAVAGSNTPENKHTQSELLFKIKSIKGWRGKINFTHPLNGSNELGFNALPGGIITSSLFSCEFFDLGTGTGWWTAELHNPHITSYDKVKFGILPQNAGDDYSECLDPKKSKSKLGHYVRLIKE